MRRYGPLAPWYDSLTEDVPYTEFADWYEQIFKAWGRPVRSLLDLACGTGTLTCLMAERGYDLVAADGSGEMLSCLTEKLAEIDCAFPPLVLCQDMRELDLYGTVDAAYCSLDGMNYLPDEDLPRVFARLHLFIEHGGLLIFDINTPERLRSLDGQTFVDETEDVLCLWRSEYSETERLLFYGMDLFVRQGQLWSREEEEHIEYVHEPETLLQMLQDAGFCRVQFREDGPQHEEGRLFVIAENG